MRIGVDLGGTKIEALAMNDTGQELARQRVETPRGDYPGTLEAIARLVERVQAEAGGGVATVGMGIPGTVRAGDGLVKNANSVWLNGMPLGADLSRRLEREVRVQNDANCLAVSEATDGAATDGAATDGAATDGAAAGCRVVFAVILGTGCGGGVAVDGKVHAGPNGIAGEWGHNPLPWPTPEEYPGPLCYCGRRGCLEKWVSGTGIADDHLRVTGKSLTTLEIAQSDDAEAKATLDRFEDRLARGLAGMVHVLDPEVIVVGGGVSRIARLYRNVPALVRGYSFGGDFDTPIVPARFGDSSGVRGAAWLWPLSGSAARDQL